MVQIDNTIVAEGAMFCLSIFFVHKLALFAILVLMAYFNSIEVPFWVNLRIPARQSLIVNHSQRKCDIVKGQKACPNFKHFHIVKKESNSNYGAQNNVTQYHLQDRVGPIWAHNNPRLIFCTVQKTVKVAKFSRPRISRILLFGKFDDICSFWNRTSTSNILMSSHILFTILAILSTLTCHF